MTFCFGAVAKDPVQDLIELALTIKLFFLLTSRIRTAVITKYL